MAALMDILLELCKFVSYQAESGVKLGIIMSVLIIYGLARIIMLGVYIIMVAICNF